MKYKATLIKHGKRCQEIEFEAESDKKAREEIGEEFEPFKIGSVVFGSWIELRDDDGRTL